MRTLFLLAGLTCFVACGSDEDTPFESSPDAALGGSGGADAALSGGTGGDAAATGGSAGQGGTPGEGGSGGVGGAGGTGAAELVAKLDFEDPSYDYKSEFTSDPGGQQYTAITDSNVLLGQHCLRGNQHHDRTDPITGLTGKAAGLDWRGAANDIAQRTPHELYFSYWLRHDDYDFGGTNEGKLLYFVDDVHSIRAMYIGGQLNHDDINITYANGGYPFLWAWCVDQEEPEGFCDACRAEGTCDNWGYSRLHLRNPDVQPAAGQWRHFEYYVNYDDHYMQFWIDGHLLLPVTSARYWETFPADAQAGRIRYSPDLELRWKGFQLFYSSTSDNRDYADPVDGTGYYLGWQIDDLEVWDGMPHAVDGGAPSR